MLAVPVVRNFMVSPLYRFIPCLSPYLNGGEEGGCGRFVLKHRPSDTVAIPKFHLIIQSMF